MNQLFESFNTSPPVSSLEYRKLDYQKLRKIGTTKLLEKAIWRVKWRYWGDFSACCAKKSNFFLQMWLDVFWEAHPLQVEPFLTWKFLFFDTLSCSVSVGWMVLKCSKFDHAWRLGNFTREIALNDEYLSQFFLDRPVLWMTLKQLFKIFIKQPMFDCNRATRLFSFLICHLMVKSHGTSTMWFWLCLWFLFCSWQGECFFKKCTAVTFKISRGQIGYTPKGFISLPGRAMDFRVLEQQTNKQTISGNEQKLKQPILFGVIDIFEKLFQSSKLKARSILTKTWQKSLSSFQLWAVKQNYKMSPQVAPKKRDRL